MGASYKQAKRSQVAHWQRLSYRRWHRGSLTGLNGSHQILDLCQELVELLHANY